MNMKTISMIGFAFTTCLSLIGCATTPPPQTNSQQLEILNKIHASAGEIQQMLYKMKRDGQLSSDEVNVLIGTKDPALEKKINMDWYGPIIPALQSIAEKTGYKLQIIGVKPPIPLIVNIDTRIDSLPNSYLQVLNNMQIQLQGNAVITVNSDHKLISLRYVS